MHTLQLLALFFFALHAGPELSETRSITVADYPVVLPYTAVIAAILIALVKKAVYALSRLFSFRFHFFLALLYVSFFVTPYLFPGLAASLGMTEVLTARSLESSFFSSISSLIKGLGDSSLPTRSSDSDGAEYTQEPTTPLSYVSAGAREDFTSSAQTNVSCSAYDVCISARKVASDYPFSVVFLSYIGDYLKDMDNVQPIRFGLAGMDCASHFPRCN
ncbi:uncharacterized protein LOC135395251 [Ornithodoros turicata]|uniref:uncharacterized protein LOC135395251 n=1 Tax=Ornithodoros turicata TaxID=34597 RepID=UPI003139EDF2